MTAVFQVVTSLINKDGNTIIQDEHPCGSLARANRICREQFDKYRAQYRDHDLEIQIEEIGPGARRYGCA